MGTIKEKIERLKKEPEEAMNGPAITHPLSVGTRPKAGEPIPAGKPKRDRRIDVFLSPALLTHTLHVVAFKDAEYPGLRVQKFASDRCVGNDPFVPIGLQGAPADAEHTPDLLAGQVHLVEDRRAVLVDQTVDRLQGLKSLLAQLDVLGRVAGDEIFHYFLEVIMLAARRRWTSASLMKILLPIAV